MIRLILGEQLGRTVHEVDEYLTGLGLSVFHDKKVKSELSSMVSSWVACTWLAGYLTRLEYLVKYSYPLTVEYVVHKLICNWVTLIVLIKGLSLMSSWVELSMSWWVPDWTWAFSYPIQVGYIVRSPVCNPHSGLHIYVWLGSSLVSNWVELSMSWWVPDWTWAFSCPIQVGYIVHIPVCNPHSGLHIYVWLGSSLVNSWVETVHELMSTWLTWAFSCPI